jgi:hypothetical protein
MENTFAGLVDYLIIYSVSIDSGVFFIELG